MEDMTILKDIYDGDITFISETNNENYRIYRLNSIGIIDIKLDELTVAVIDGSEALKQLVSINYTGKKFLEIALS